MVEDKFKKDSILQSQPTTKKHFQPTDDDTNTHHPSSDQCTFPGSSKVECSLCNYYINGRTGRNAPKIQSQVHLSSIICGKGHRLLLTSLIAWFCIVSTMKSIKFWVSTLTAVHQSRCHSWLVLFWSADPSSLSSEVGHWEADYQMPQPSSI